MNAIRTRLPGLLLCALVAAAAFAVQGVEARLLHRAWLEALVIAIVLGAAIRTAWTPGPVWTDGVAFGAKTVLEIAVVLLGATVTARTVLAAGPPLLAGIAGVVLVGIIASYGLGRLFGLPHRMATLIAAGNSICGNSAIAAVAPVIGADGDDVVASIAFTAVLGVVVVIGLPFMALWLRMNPQAFGVFAGLTVYAVPQVLAATAPISSLSAQVGTLVKLVRVLMLGPVVMIIALITRWRGEGPTAGRSGKRALNIQHLLPWFILGFLALIVARSVGVIPDLAVKPISEAATVLTIISMAALGLGVDVRVVAKAGARVTSVVTLSLIVLGLVAWLLIRALGLI